MAEGRHTRGSVLIVDDEPTIGEVVSRYLDRAGYETSVALDGPSALRKIEQQSPDLVVLDLMLPRISGLELMRRIRDRGSDRTSIILLTAKGEELLGKLTHLHRDELVRVKARLLSAAESRPRTLEQKEGT